MIISDDALENKDGVLLAIMSRLVVVRCEHLYASRAFEYYAYSPDFAPVEPGVIPPAYLVVVHTVDGVVDSFEFVENTPVNLADVKL